MKNLPAINNTVRWDEGDTTSGADNCRGKEDNTLYSDSELDFTENSGKHFLASLTQILLHMGANRENAFTEYRQNLQSRPHHESNRKGPSRV